MATYCTFTIRCNNCGTEFHGERQDHNPFGMTEHLHSVTLRSVHAGWTSPVVNEHGHDEDRCPDCALPPPPRPRWAVLAGDTGAQSDG
jgi:hypothetical protein